MFFDNGSTWGSERGRDCTMRTLQELVPTLIAAADANVSDREAAKATSEAVAKLCATIGAVTVLNHPVPSDAAKVFAKVATALRKSLSKERSKSATAAVSKAKRVCTELAGMPEDANVVEMTPGDILDDWAEESFSITFGKVNAALFGKSAEEKARASLEKIERDFGIDWIMTELSRIQQEATSEAVLTF